MNGKNNRVQLFRIGLALAVLLILLTSTVGAQMASQHFQIPSSAMVSSGGVTSSDNFEMQNTMGQSTPSGAASSSNFGLFTGFQPTTMWTLPSPCIDFEPPLPLGTQYHVGDSFVSDGVTIEVKRFKLSNNQWTYDGFAQVGNTGQACGSGQEILINNANLEFNFGGPIPALSLLYGYYGGNLNMLINGSLLNFADFSMVTGQTVNGVTISASNTGQGCGTLTLSGTINSFFIGGQEFFIDHVCPGQEQVEQYHRGDCNCDGDIDILDVLSVVNHILGTVPIDPSDLWLADCNGDGEVNVLDAVGIVNVILGTGECVPGACKTEVTDETLKFLKALEPHLPAEEFERFMALVKPEIPVPTEYSLAQNYPNPFNPTTTIAYTIPSTEQRAQSAVKGADSKLSALRTTLKIYNLLGQKVRTLVDDVQEPGYYSVSWDGRDSDGREIASGVYFYRLSVNGSKESRFSQSGQWSETKRMVLMK